MPAIIQVVKLTSVSLQATHKNTKTPHIILIIYIYLYITKQNSPDPEGVLQYLATRCWQDGPWWSDGHIPLPTCPSLVPSAVNGESAWERWLVCGCAVPNITNCNALCCLRPFYQNQHECSRASVSLGCSWPCCCITTVFSLDPFYRSWWLQTRNTPPQLRFWRCSVDPLPLGSGQNHPNPYAQLWR